MLKNNNIHLDMENELNSLSEFVKNEPNGLTRLMGIPANDKPYIATHSLILTIGEQSQAILEQIEYQLIMAGNAYLSVERINTSQIIPNHLNYVNDKPTCRLHQIEQPEQLASLSLEQTNLILVICEKVNENSIAIMQNLALRLPNTYFITADKQKNHQLEKLHQYNDLPLLFVQTLANENIYQTLASVATTLISATLNLGVITWEPEDLANTLQGKSAANVYLFEDQENLELAHFLKRSHKQFRKDIGKSKAVTAVLATSPKTSELESYFEFKDNLHKIVHPKSKLLIGTACAEQTKIVLISTQK